MLEKDKPEFCRSIELVNEDIFKWEVEIVGPDESPYAGGIFPLTIDFPTQYPFKAPKLKFNIQVYHPSIQLKSGDVCQDVLGQWGPTLNAKHCLTVVYSMLQDPSASSDHPLEEEVAKQLAEKPKDFEKAAKKYTKEYAMKKK